ncbi:ATP-dependent DNA helicase [Weizmannia acidilactici]|uniref:ATP-dependent DNA helicase RecQ n=1 Tax=Weizmannia acidilactici TaxID=2607726 RepID=A0A5J4JC22_9BACI|nr:ATP-dependent DNA helicase RecQ [Weizmannia acidilactici]GER66054.1 ATP-dependent DNA helicase [Weizmannia acidilactici]GER69311.1 ATP-dependent DNA helicase [Weizmannia acidilactici]GER72363.1 ATP-dependent DNA helicase [Weizmannia acidilactici]
MDLNSILKTKFGFDRFREGQEAVIRSLLGGADTLAMLPTGTGKSLCYQLPAYLLKGSVIVVSPLLSLMQDQTEQMKMRGEKSVIALNSFLTGTERETALRHLQRYKFIFISPEMLHQPYILSRIKQLEIGLFVVDEAHCISQWGYDFRPEYLSLGEVRKSLGMPLTLALTATATEQVREDICKYLELRAPQRFIYSVNRPNIAFKVDCTGSYREKEEKLIAYAKTLKKPGIIYFSSKKAAEEMAERLRLEGIAETAAYHSGVDQEQRILIQQQFIYGQIGIICATSAFGMGINKADIRFVIHFHFPLQMESYLQEIGRAGRDGLPSIAILLYTAGDELLPLQLIESELPTHSQIAAFSGWKGDVKDAEFALGCTEQQYSFLQHYKKLQLPEEEWTLKVASIRDERMAYKRRKLKEMEHWVRSEACRRQEILRYFGEPAFSEKENCCDICGFDVGLYEEKQAVQRVAETLPAWDFLLQKIFRRSEQNG